jgi:hypothetical protein
MLHDRGYCGSVEQLRRVVARLPPQPREAFLRLQVFPAEEATPFTQSENRLVSARWQNAIDRPSSRATKLLTNAAGPTIAPALWPRHSFKSGLVCCRCPFTLSRRIA